ncbi:hypothetical protein D9757_000077 [Collybiopsis confluens]|uniref:Helicase C-terminal domain-containing protein n=1 Tax=Collybiopsis confluens TaxID=2823264 RepID=A0A8H5MGP1_9AGAR|nr:hypothetical protein D9757_000077 [Collybiopsis confluens]
MDFVPELSHLFNVLPKDRQTCLFTATLTPSIENVANAPPRPGKQKPFIHQMSEKVETVSTLKQSYILVPSHVRESYLLHFLCNPPESTLHLRHGPPDPSTKKKQSKPKKKESAEDEAPEQPPPTIIFCTRPRTAAYLTYLLKTLSIRSTALHSRLTQRERLTSLSLFRSSIVPVLISTDVGARGLDIEDVAIVINWDLPDEPEEYTHRVGRTARAGKGGVAVSFVTERDEERVLKIEDRIGVQLEELILPENKVLEKLNIVSTAKRLANMELHDSDFGKREKTNRLKALSDHNPTASLWKSPAGIQFSSSRLTAIWTSVCKITISQSQHSNGGSPICEDPSDSNVLVSISTTFYPGANLHTLPPDLALLSSDSVFFYVHSHMIFAASDNNFRSLVPSSPSKKQASNMVIHVPELSPVLNIILHAIYDMSCNHYSPSFETLSTAVNQLPLYGTPPKTRITPNTPLHALLLSHAPLFPLDVYTLAARHDMYELAVSASPHLLSFQLSNLTDEMAEAIGPKYLRRMFFLHIGRSDALKRPPHPHAPTPFCDFTDQKTLTRAWALASAYLAWDARPAMVAQCAFNPDLSTGFLESALAPLAEHLSCDLCKQGLKDRIKNLIVQWSVVKRRPSYTHI